MLVSTFLCPVWRAASLAVSSQSVVSWLSWRVVSPVTLSVWLSPPPDVGAQLSHSHCWHTPTMGHLPSSVSSPIPVLSDRDKNLWLTASASGWLLLSYQSDGESIASVTLVTTTHLLALSKKVERKKWHNVDTLYEVYTIEGNCLAAS